MQALAKLSPLISGNLVALWLEELDTIESEIDSLKLDRP